MKEQKEYTLEKSTAACCKGCPYPSTGFLCGSRDGECMKTRMQKIKNSVKREGGIHG